MDNILFRIARVKGEDGILKVAIHNKREFTFNIKENIDPTKSPLNYSLLNAKPARQIAIEAKISLLTAGIDKLRKDAVHAVEIIFGLPANKINEDTTEFFNDCFVWVKESIEGQLISFDVHLDEAAPHAHALIHPLINGKMIGSEVIGYRTKLKMRIKSFLDLVGSKHGLVNPSKAKLGKLDRDVMSKSVLRALKSDPMMNSKIFSVVSENIKKNPRPYADMLDIKNPLKIKKVRSFVQIMTSKGKGKATEAYSV